MEHLGVLRMSRVILELPSGRKGLVSLLLPPLPGVPAMGGVSEILGTDAAFGVVEPLGVRVAVAEARVGVSARLDMVA